MMAILIKWQNPYCTYRRHLLDTRGLLKQSLNEIYVHRLLNKFLNKGTVNDLINALSEINAFCCLTPNTSHAFKFVLHVPL